MKPKERIPLHDHTDNNSGGRIAGSAITGLESTSTGSSVIPDTSVETLSAELVGDGSSNVFSIDRAYATGTLIVFVAGIDVNDDLTESDPTTGEITLAFVPELGERITVLGR